jgi:N-acetylneuraminic acid mutarotase
MTNRIRNASAGLLFLVCLVTLTSAFNLPNRSPPDPSSRLASLGTVAKSAQQRTVLTLADRVAYQRAIEEVYWRHRIWPKANAGPKPPLDKVMPQAEIEKKVEDYLRNSQALSDYWQRPITPDQLQAEMERIASHSKQPVVLREIFAALGNDPFVIAECLAKPVLAERLLTELYAHDQRFHGELKQRAEAELRTHPRVRQMKRTSGRYTEMEWIKSDTAQEEDDRVAERSVKLNRSEWQEKVAKLAAQFDAAGLPNARIRRGRPPDASITRDEQAGPDAWAQIKTGVLSPLQEDDGHYYAVAVTKKGKDRLKLATIAWLKEPLRSWVTRAETQVPMTMAGISSANYTLPVIASPSGGCTDDTWAPTSLTNAPTGRYVFTAVWTGTEMIVWGGQISSGYANTGGRYSPSTDSWTATSTTNAPAGRSVHTAVWTGTEMIVWGGYNGSFLSSGGRYNPSTDSWTATSTTNAPASRRTHTAVWTGSEMIVWGGSPTISTYLNTGGRYNPSTDSWTATSTTNAPTARRYHTAVWTGSEMIVWGGYFQDNSNHYWNTGGRYDPSSDSWTATSTTNAPDGRAIHTAIWTGSQMIVWGGTFFDGNIENLNTGGIYIPGTDSWTATSTANAPGGRYRHTAVWTGSQMIIWGGGLADSTFLNTGGRYSLSTDSWTATSATDVPTAREDQTAVWTGSQMIIWGGYNGGYEGTGGRYCAQPSTPIVQSAVSRKSHGGAGSFDVDLPLTGTPGLECRSGGATGDYTIVVTFLANVSVNGNPQAAVTSGIGTIGSGGMSNGGMVITSGSVVTIPLTNVANAQTINVTLNNVNGSTNVTIPMGVLIGDVNGNAAVNASDVSLTKAQVGVPVSGSNFREDVNANGTISATDVAQVKAHVGTALPP